MRVCSAFRYYRKAVKYRARFKAGPRTPIRSRPARRHNGDREQAEVLVDCVTYCVLGSVGLDVGGESIHYVAGWGEDGALDAIRQYAGTIDAIARRIETHWRQAPIRRQTRSLRKPTLQSGSLGRGLHRRR